jgi:hypothetical protein
MLRQFKNLLLFLCFAGLCAAHVGSPDIYLDGNAGPYKLFVTIRPPQVIPGVAEIEVRSETAGVHELKAVPMPLSGAGSDHAPVADSLRRAAGDSQFFTGSLWLMADGSWQVRITAEGTQGVGTLSIPVPAVARTTRTMQWQLGMVLSVLGVFLIGGLAAISGAAVREATLSAGKTANETRTRNGRIAAGVSFCLIAFALWGGKAWWDSEVDIYQGRIYKPLNMRARLEDSSVLLLNLSEPGWMQPPPLSAPLSPVLFVRKMDDLVLDHDHLMHLYVIRQPGLDVIYHLHPDLAGQQFRLVLPAMPAGDYKLYADVVHENGLPETMTASLHLPNGITADGARPLSGDDARGQAMAIGSADPSDTFALPDGYRMRWIHDALPLHARQGSQFRFELLAPNGSKPEDMELYMGMVGHAAFVKTDGTVFAHIHPNGTVSMAALMMAQGNNNDMPGMGHNMANMQSNGAIPNEVTFPYGLPTTGKYRIFVQMKHGSTIETGIFDATAD